MLTSTAVTLLGQAGTLGRCNMPVSDGDIVFQGSLPGSHNGVRPTTSQNFGKDHQFDEAQFYAPANVIANLSIDVLQRSLAVEMVHFDKTTTIIGTPAGTSPVERLPDTIRIA